MNNKNSVAPMSTAPPVPISPDTVAPTISHVTSATATETPSLMPSLSPIRISFENKNGMDAFCDTGPEALSQALVAVTDGQSLPQQCVPNLINGGGEEMLLSLRP